MRIGGFILGGMLGALAVSYLNRNGKSMISSRLAQTGQSVGEMMNNAKTKMSGMKTNSVHSTDSQDFNANEVLRRVEELVDQDPHVKQKVHEIITET